MTESVPLSAEFISRFFRSLGDPTRLKIITCLMEGEQSVSDLVSRLSMGQGRISTHLSCLKACGCVQSRPQGRFVYYRITDDRLVNLVQLASSMAWEHSEKLNDCLKEQAQGAGYGAAKAARAKSRQASPTLGNS